MFMLTIFPIIVLRISQLHGGHPVTKIGPFLTELQLLLGVKLLRFMAYEVVWGRYRHMSPS